MQEQKLRWGLSGKSFWSNGALAGPTTGPRTTPGPVVQECGRSYSVKKIKPPLIGEHLRAKRLGSAHSPMSYPAKENGCGNPHSRRSRFRFSLSGKNRVDAVSWTSPSRQCGGWARGPSNPRPAGDRGLASQLGASGLLLTLLASARSKYPCIFRFRDPGSGSCKPSSIARSSSSRISRSARTQSSFAEPGRFPRCL